MAVAHFPLARLAAALKADGIAVRVLDGAQGRSARMFATVGYQYGCQASVVHHTASSGHNPASDIAYILNGKGDGFVIANCYTARDGTVTLIASGPTYTEGQGGPIGSIPADNGNRYCFSNEIGGGLGAPFPAAQTKAALHLHSHVSRIAADVWAWPGDPFDRTRIFAHAEWSPGRKVDPMGESPWASGYTTWNMDAFRRDAAALVPPPPEEDDMRYPAESDRVHDSRPGFHQTTTATQATLKPGTVRTIEAGMASQVAVRMAGFNAKGPGYMSVAGVAKLANPTVNFWNGSNGDGVMFLATDGGKVYIATTVECDVTVDVFGRS